MKHGRNRSKSKKTFLLCFAAAICGFETFTIPEANSEEKAALLGKIEAPLGAENITPEAQKNSVLLYSVKEVMALHIALAFVDAKEKSQECLSLERMQVGMMGKSIFTRLTREADKASVSEQLKEAQQDLKTVTKLFGDKGEEILEACEYFGKTITENMEAQAYSIK